MGDRNNSASFHPGVYMSTGELDTGGKSATISIQSRGELKYY